MNLPESLLQSLQQVKGFDEEAFKKVHLSGEQITSVRLNPAKTFNLQALTFQLQQEPVPWSNYGFYLSERPSFTADPLFHAGAYYVQEASSMFLQQALQQTVDCLQSVKVLDCCAAPGGKSTLIQSLITADSLLISNEVIKTRVNILSENITKWGAANVIVTNNDPKDFQRLENYFDVIVVDAPCSGSGLFRKDNAAIEEWSINNVALCSQRQQRILADVIASLKENGILIYSTCSYSTAEDETICDWLIEELDVETVALKLLAEWNIVETISEKKQAYGYRFYPDQLKGEGFFIAAFKKNGAASFTQHVIKERNAAEKISKNEIEIVKPWLKNADDFFFIKQNDEIIAMPLHLQEEFNFIQSSLYIKKAGVRMGTVIRNELIPHHELALSTILKDDIPYCEVDLENALQYLRKQDVKMETSIKGWALIKYQQMPLGWIKALPNRINNYYPKEWRILNK
ncbi:methyltransferase RsmF C-terminal domain-like protein [Ferruginibacter sp. SUN106]|uniref:methyltransferase RsmF C-terminal domain-like protein n=1 Tax=Ferruginibacter sp. SUN106 TaxID=2978348 RepID=UPI003D36EC82